MSGHSKWSTIKHKKAASDAKRGKIFTKHAKIIEVAAKGGSDPEMNPSLRSAIDNARSDNMPFDNIDRAVKKGSGELKDAAQIEEVIYEGFGPGGSAVYIQCLTDNRNRTITNLKIIMGKKGGTMGAAGSVGYLFEKKGLIEILAEGKNIEDIELMAIDAGAEDINIIDDIVEIFTDPQQLMKVRDDLKKNDLKSKSANLTFIPTTEVDITDAGTAEQLLELIDTLEDDDDVSEIFTNANIADDLLDQV